MNFEIDKKINLEYRKTRIAQYGDAVGSVGYGSVESQEARFKIVCEIDDFSNKTILDVGCGFGDLYTFLNRQSIRPRRYLGIEISSDLLDMAKKRLPELEFRLVSLLDFKSTEKFDYVIACGVFGLESPNWQPMLEKQLGKLYDLCEMGVVANFLSCYTSWGKAADSHYASPEDILEFVLKNLSNRVVLRHDYRPNDFTIYVYKGNEEHDRNPAPTELSSVDRVIQQNKSV